MAARIVVYVHHLRYLESAMCWAHLRRLLVASTCILLLYPTYSAQAQWKTFDTRLKSDDLAALKAATMHLLDRPQLAEGAFEAWSNPRSGVNGTIVAGKPLIRNGTECWALDYFMHVPGPNADRDRAFTWCRTNDGWKIGE
jgi:hypothetical protein